MDECEVASPKKWEDCIINRRETELSFLYETISNSKIYLFSQAISDEWSFFGLPNQYNILRNIFNFKYIYMFFIFMYKFMHINGMNFWTLLSLFSMNNLNLLWSSILANHWLCIQLQKGISNWAFMHDFIFLATSECFKNLPSSLRKNCRNQSFSSLQN